nr:VOC family protein [Marinicella sp. NBU2979]
MSADIAIPRHAEMVQFYAQILTTGEEPLWQADLMNNQGTPVIGLGPQSPDYAGLPVQWMPHFQVADVAQSAHQAVKLGGTELMHGKDDAGMSQWAVIQDHNGAVFGLIPVVSEAMVPDYAQDESAPYGHIAWLDLTVPNAETTRDFYQAVIGSQAEDVPMQDGDQAYADYNMLGSDGQACGGVCHASGSNQTLPPVWLIYLPVGDLDASLKWVEQKDGKLIKTYQNNAGQTTMAVIQDPVGAYVALAQG